MTALPLRYRVSAVTLVVTLTSCVHHRSGIEVSLDDGGAPAISTSGAQLDPSAAPGVERGVIDRAPLVAGERYRASDALQDIDAVFTAPASTLFGLTTGHRLAFSTDPEGVHTVLAALPIANLRVFTSPELEQGDMDQEDVERLTTEAPDDIVEWLASRPFLQASTIDDHLELGRLEGRGFSYQVGELTDGAQACGPVPAPRCGATIYSSRIPYHVATGERGSVLEVAVDGQRLLVMVASGAATDELLSTLTLEVPPPPKEVGPVTRLPYFAPTVEAGVDYYVDKVKRGLGLVVTAPAPVTGSQRDEVAWFGDPAQSPAARHYYFVASDADTVVVNDDPSLDPYALAGPGGIVLWELRQFLARTAPLPDDVIGWLTSQPYLEVVAPERKVDVGGWSARVADVRALAVPNGIPCPDRVGTCLMPFAHAADAFPMVISSEYVTRVVDLTVGKSRVLITADLGTPGEPLLDSLHAFDLAASH